MWGEAARRKPGFAAHCCVGRRAQRTASSHGIFLLAGCPENPPLLDLFCDPARAFPVPMTALNSRACLLWWGWGPANALALSFILRRRGTGAWARRLASILRGWGCSPLFTTYQKKTMPFCYRSRLLLLLCLLTFSARDFLGAFPHSEEQMSQIPKFERGREKSQEDY